MNISTSPITKIWHIVDGLNAKYPSGNAPFQLVARLCEEAGELAKAVNHIEGSGIKLQKYGPATKSNLAKEVQDVMRSAVSIAKYYGIEAELQASVDASYAKLVDDGYLIPDDASAK